jgi:hypothetical protein
MALTSFFTLILVAPVGTYLVRKAIEWHAHGVLIEPLKHALIYLCAASAFATLLTMGLVRIGLLETSVFAGPLVGFAILGVGLSGFGSPLFNYLGQPFKYVTLSVLTSWAGVAIAGVLCLRVSATAETWMMGNIAAQVAAGFAVILLVVMTMGPSERLYGADTDSRPPGFDLWAIAMYSAPMLVATFLAWFQTDGYRYLFVHMVDERTLGLFAAGMAVGISPLLLLERMISDSYTPILNRAVALKGRGQWPASWDEYASAAILPVVLFTVLSCTGTSLFAKLLVSRTYYAVAWLGALGALAKGLQMMSSLYVVFSYAVLETAHLVRPFLFGTLATVACIFLLSPIHQPYLIFGASLICGAAVGLFAIAFAARRRYGVRFPYFALVRACVLGLPIVAVNCGAKILSPTPSSPGAVVLLAADTLYIAAVCWMFHPKEADSEPRIPVGIAVAPEQEMQA